MKPVWKVFLYVAEALLSAIKSVFGGKDIKDIDVK